MISKYLRRWIRPLLPDHRAQVLDQLRRASSPDFDFFLLVFLSTCIATFGLLTNSAAVVIGAMLVAPLMSPILGLSLASVAGEHRMFERAAGGLARGVLLTIALSALLSWLAQLLPFDVLAVLPVEIVARTRPSLFDLGIALAGGAAASYALAQPDMSAALPGVAIATALVPPLCTVGVGLSLMDPNIFLGALLLFVTNLVAISFAGIVVFALLGFRPRYQEERIFGLPRHFVISITLVLLVAIPLVWLSLRLVSQSRDQQAAQALQTRAYQVVKEALVTFPRTQLVAVETSRDKDSPDNLHLLITVRSSELPSYARVLNLQEAVASRLQMPVSIELVNVPMLWLDPKIPPTPTPTATLGPSATPSPIPTRTSTAAPPTRTATASPTPTETSTPTQTYTPTPVMAFISGPNGLGAYLRDTPGGKISVALPYGAPVQILYARETLDNVVWLEIRDLFGRSGWVPAHYLVIRP